MEDERDRFTRWYDQQSFETLVLVAVFGILMSPLYLIGFLWFLNWVFGWGN